MNRLDNLPEDIKKKINRKVQDLHIKERRIERKQNRANNRLLKYKKDVREKLIKLVMEHYKNKTNDVLFNILRERFGEHAHKKLSIKYGVLGYDDEEDDDEDDELEKEIINSIKSTILGKNLYDIFREKLYTNRTIFGYRIDYRDDTTDDDDDFLLCLMGLIN
jgi:hypothetical protein